MYKSISVMLIAVAISTPAHAEIFGFLSSNGGSEQIMDGQVHAPAQNTVVDGSMHGYPFYSGCCDSGSYGKELWDGYCGSKGCGMKAHHGRHHGGLKGGSGCGDCCGMGYGHNPCAYGDCGKGGCGYAAPHGFGGKSSWGGFQSYRGLGGKGGCGVGAPCESKGCDTCDPCAPKHGRFGLFSRMHAGHGKGCDACGGVGCNTCSGGKGGFGKGGYIEYGAPIHGYDKNYYGTPSESDDHAAPQPPEVLVEPTSTSDRSAWRRQVPTSPFARPFSY